MYKLLPLSSLLLLSFVISFGQTNQDKLLVKKFDHLFSSKFKPAEPGGEVLIAQKGQVIYKNTFGSASLELTVPIKPGMVFKIGSVTKQFTAVAILQLVEQGKIALQDSLQQYVKDFPSKGYTITIENLLTHTSGLKDYLQVGYAAVNMERWDMEPKQVIDSFKNIPLEFEPGTKFRYSNTGYFLLGYIIEKITGKSYYKYIEDNLIKPLELTHTCFDTSGIIISNRANGYRKEGEVFKNADFWSMTVAYSAGGLLSTVEDLYKWHKGLNSYKILQKETLQRAFTSYKLKDGTSTGYGYGWMVKNYGDTKSIEHSGAISGFLSNAIYFPAEDVFIVLLFNSDNAPRDEFSVPLCEMITGKSFQPSLKIPEQVMDSYTGTYALTTDTARTVTVSKENGHLVGEVSGQASFELIFQSETAFQFKNVLDAKCEFVSSNGKVTRLVVYQNGVYEWIKIK